MPNDRAVVPGSIGALAQSNNVSVAESFLTADLIVVVDVSGSMDADDAPGRRKRYTVACEELAKTQESSPGKVAVVAFSSDVRFVPGGVPPFLGQGTDLASALRYVLLADGTVKFVIISDGAPNDPDDALKVASKFTSKLDTIFIGSESDSAGRDFLRRLAAASGGIAADSFKATGLGATVGLLLKAG